MIAVGESSGKLDEVFKQIGFYIERDEETRKKIKSAMRYPSFVLGAMVVAITVVNVLVIPEFSKLFEKFDVQLPLVTKILIGTSNIFVSYWPYMLVALAVGVVTLVRYLKSEKGSLAWGKNKMRMPVVGGLVERAVAEFYEREVEYDLNTLTDRIEPVLIAFMAGFGKY